MASAPRLQRIDATHRDAHTHIRDSDDCLFALEYTSGQSFNYGDTNSLISNLKKPPSRRGRAEYRYKTQAMQRAVDIFNARLDGLWLREAVLVPVPPSKAKDHPEYDDRMLKICQRIEADGVRAVVREIVTQRQSTDAAHTSSTRPTVPDLIANYRIEEAACTPAPSAIGIVDDVLTAGTHYRAMHTVLSRRFPDARITGLFIARRIFPEDEHDDFGHLLDLD